MIDVFVFSNGNYAVCRDDGQQVPEAQGSWLLLIVDRMKAAGVGLNPLDALFHLPDGHKAQLFMTDEGYNWKILD